MIWKIPSFIALYLYRSLIKPIYMLIRLPIFGISLPPFCHNLVFVLLECRKFRHFGFFFYFFFFVVEKSWQITIFMPNMKVVGIILKKIGLKVLCPLKISSPDNRICVCLFFQEIFQLKLCQMNAMLTFPYFKGLCCDGSLPLIIYCLFF